MFEFRRPSSSSVLIKIHIAKLEEYGLRVSLSGLCGAMRTLEEADVKSSCCVSVFYFAMKIIGFFT